MAQLIVRNIDEDVKARLKRRAELHGHSMEEEVRQILLAAAFLPIDPDAGLGSRIAKRFRKLGEPPLIEELRGEVRPAEFD
jgi:plasmid stability protein